MFSYWPALSSASFSVHNWCKSSRYFPFELQSQNWVMSQWESGDSQWLGSLIVFKLLCVHFPWLAWEHRLCLYHKGAWLPSKLHTWLLTDLGDCVESKLFKAVKTGYLKFQLGYICVAFPQPEVFTVINMRKHYRVWKAAGMRNLLKCCLKADR